jgi:succinate-semialdehyde dehydrogenase/glutarate-semialdehyde dehydrogenase
VVVRPSANTPLSALAVVQLAEEVGFPKGVINLVVGHDHDAIAGTLSTHPEVDKVSFTGSTRVGRLLMSQGAATLKKLSLELGGNAAFIVFDDADVDAAVEGALLSKFRNAGQTCVCANRILVQKGIYPTFVEKLSQKVATLKVGDGFDKDTKVGPLISESALMKTESFVKDAVAKGAKVLAGGKRAKHVNKGKGWFYEPTLLEGVTQEMSVMADEIFGPVVRAVTHSHVTACFSVCRMPATNKPLQCRHPSPLLRMRQTR